MTYKKFKIEPITENIKRRFSLYSSLSLFVIINPNGDYEWETDTVDEAKQWIDCY